MSKFFIRNKLIFNAIGASAFMLASFLVACDHSSDDTTAIAIPTDPEDIQASESSSSDDEVSSSSSVTFSNDVSSSSAKANTYGLERYKACDKAIDGRYLKYAYLYGGSGGPSSSASDGSYIEGGPSLDAYKYGFFKCEDGEWLPAADKEVPLDSDVFFVSSWKDDVCDADHENVIDSVWNADGPSGIPVYFYRRCEDGEWIYKNRSVTCDTKGVAVGDTCRRAEYVNVVSRGFGNSARTQNQYWDRIYSYAGDGKWEEFSCNTSLPEACSPTNNDLSYEKISKDNGSYTYSIYCKCMDVVVGYESGVSFDGSKYHTYSNPIHGVEWHDVSEDVYVPIEDSLAAVNSFNPDEIRPCDKTLEIDGRVIKHEYKTAKIYNGYDVDLTDSMSKYLYYKCEDGKWSIFREKNIDDDGNVLDSASVIFFAELGVKHLYDFKKCNADNEKLVDSLPSPDSKLASYDFYRCEQGAWVQRGPSVTCDIAGVSIGDTCKRAPFVGSSLEEIYIYAGDGIWEESKTVHLAPLTKDCSAENEDSYVTQVDTIVKIGASPAYETSYYHCESNEWKRVDCPAPETACTNNVEGKIDSTKGLLPVESRTQDVNTTTCRFTCTSGKWTRM